MATEKQLAANRRNAQRSTGPRTAKGKAAKRWTFYIGADGKILAIDKEVKTDTHGADVASKLGELGVKKNK